MSILYTGPNNLRTLADELTQIAQEGDAKTRDVFAPTIRQLRELSLSNPAIDPMDPNATPPERYLPILDSFVAACGEPVE